MSTSRNASLWVTSLLVALGVLMLAAVVAPRLFDLESINWGVSVGLAVIAGVVTYFVASARGGSRGSKKPVEPRL